MKKYLLATIKIEKIKPDGTNKESYLVDIWKGENIIMFREDNKNKLFTRIKKEVI